MSEVKITLCNLPKFNQAGLSDQDKLFLQKYGRLPPKKAALGQRLKVKILF
jgi:hypothetical protein